MAKKKPLLDEAGEEIEEVKSYIPIRVGKEQAYIWSDSRQWMWGYKTCKIRKRGEARTEAYEPEGYYSTLQGVLSGILDKKLRLAEYKSFEDLLNEVRKFKKEMLLLYDTTINDDQAFVVPSGRKKQLETDYRYSG